MAKFMAAKGQMPAKAFQTAEIEPPAKLSNRNFKILERVSEITTSAEPIHPRV